MSTGGADPQEGNCDGAKGVQTDKSDPLFCKVTDKGDGEQIGDVYR